MVYTEAESFDISVFEFFGSKLNLFLYVVYCTVWLVFALSSEWRTVYALYLLNSNAFDLSALQGASLAAPSASKSLKIFLRIRSKSFKRENFDVRQGKFKNDTVVYLQNFLQNYAKFSFSNRK